MHAVDTRRNVPEDGILSVLLVILKDKCVPEEYNKYVSYIYGRTMF
jgi:hypothetical protein